MTTQQRLDIWFEQALELTGRAQKFYAQAAQQGAKEKSARDLFIYLAEQNQKHHDKIRKIYESLAADAQGQSCWFLKKDSPGPDPQITAIFHQLQYEKNSPAADLMVAIDEGLALENMSKDLYLAQIPKASCDAEAQFLQIMIDEIDTRSKALADMKLYYTDPESYNEQLDFIQLDGA